MEEDSIPEEESVRQGRGAPDLETWKDHIRWYIASAEGKLDPNPSVSSVKNHAERVFAGFTTATGTPTEKKDRCEIYKVRESN